MIYAWDLFFIPIYDINCALLRHFGGMLDDFKLQTIIIKEPENEL